ncbi:hypothetical protein [Aurantimonas coralicida]|uniref:hypothetical protein n=1 Tax=Aurantimonas coralicida TaxID=182270 RepID=UPI001E555632|nr:hypothetical protein [Aurantimonas coralicida]MCD1645236.1 hypothetical protein [Aurantimonas coralicida]
MAAFFDPVWAVDGDTEVPSEAQIRIGFTCGSVSPELFNYLFQNIEATINALDVENMVPTSRLINTNNGVTGGGDLTQDRTLSLDILGLATASTIANDDWIPIYDQSGTSNAKISRANLVAGLGGAGGTLSGVENIGTGTGEIFAALDGTDIQLRTLLAGAGIEITTGANEITIAFDDLPAELTVE